MTKQSNPFLEKLRKGISLSGDFPMRASSLRSLRQLSGSEVDSKSLETIILSDPALSLRALSHFTPASDTKDHSVKKTLAGLQVNDLIGLSESIAQLDQDLELDEKESSVRNRLSFSLLVSCYLEGKVDREDKPAFLAGTLVSLPELLLSYYFPHVLELALERSRDRDKTLSKSISEVVGVSFEEIVSELTISLNLRGDLKAEVSALAKGEGLLYEATKIKDEMENLCFSLLDSESSQFEINAISSIDADILQQVLPKFRELCSQAGIDSSNLERLVVSAPKAVKNMETPIEEDSGLSEDIEILRPYLLEVLETVRNAESLSSRAGAALEALVFGFGFERAMFLRLDKQRDLLEGKMALGENVPTSPSDISRLINDPRLENSVYIRALISGKVETSGQSLFKKEKGSLALRISTGSSIEGVLYADRPKRLLSPKAFGAARMMAEKLTGQPKGQENS